MKVLLIYCKNSTSVFEWQTELERIIAQQIYSSKDSNIFMKAVLDPDILEQTFLEEVREIQDEDKEGMENMEEEEDELSNEKI